MNKMIEMITNKCDKCNKIFKQKIDYTRHINRKITCESKKEVTIHDIPKHTDLYQNIPKHTELYQNIPKSTKIDRLDNHRSRL